MTEQSIFEQLKEIIVEQMGVPPHVVTPEARLVQDLGCDSLDIIEILIEVEDTFEIQVSDDDAARISTVAEAVAAIEKLKA